MSSRGAKVKNGHVTTDEYETVKTVQDAKVLAGRNGAHGLPDYSHSPNRTYIKENKDGSFRELKAYDSHGAPIIEIGYHAEPNLSGNRHTKVLHYHIFDANLNRELGGRVSATEHSDIYEKYKNYLEVYGL